MDCMRNEYVPQKACLGTVDAGSVIVFPNEEESPKLVTTNKRVRNVTGGTVDTVGVVDCATGALMWYSDRYDVILVEEATLVYRLAGREVTKRE